MGMRTGKLVVAVGVLLSAVLCPAAERYLHRFWTTAHGLPQSTVYSLCQGRDGRLWIGTDGGLASFDGQRFTTFARINNPAFLSNSITSVLEDRKGVLWIGTYGGGLIRCENNRFRRYGATEGIGGSAVWTLFEDDDGGLWVGTLDDGLRRLRGERFIRPFFTRQVWPDDKIMAMCRAADGGLWVGTRSGLVRVEKDRLRVYRRADGLPDEYVSALLADASGGLWVGTLKGLAVWREGRFTAYTAAQGLPHPFVRSLAADGGGGVWVGTDGGLCRWRAGRIESPAAGIALSDNSVMTLLLDRERNLWLGTSGGGLNWLHERAVHSLTRADGLGGDYLLALACAADGTLGFGGYGWGGQWRKPGGGSRPGPVVLPGASVYSLLPEADGGWWIGTADGLYRRVGERLVRCDAAMGYTAGGVNALYRDRGGVVWVATAGRGLFRFSAGRFTFLTNPVGAHLYSLCEDRRGGLWVGSAGGGAACLLNGNWTVYGREEGLPCRALFDLQLDREGALWAAADNGLYRFDGRRFVTCPLSGEGSDGLMYRILQDESDNLWLGSNKGVMLVESRQWREWLAGRRQRLQVRLLRESDGLPATVCNGGFQPAGCRTPDGRLWFPTMKGAAVIDPRQFTAAAPPPRPLVEGVWADGRLQPGDPAMVLPRHTRRLEFSFTAPYFLEAAAVHFHCRLEGLEENWNSIRGERTAVYHNLAPGEYRFVVRASLGEGEWGPAAVQVVRIPAGFWRSGGWLLPLLLLLAAGGAVFWRLRRRAAAPGEKYRYSSLQPRQMEQACRRLRQLMESEKPYLDPDLSLAELARRLGLPAKHLSQVVNVNCGQNFNDFVNAYRIAEAQSRLQDPRFREEKLLKIAFDCGFNSKSVFNAAFKKHAGCSPSEFRRKPG